MMAFICLFLDCCDGSDEWVNNELMNNVCQNMCKELNDTATKEIKRIEYLYDLGYEIRAQLIIKGKYLLIQKQVGSYFTLVLTIIYKYVLLLNYIHFQEFNLCVELRIKTAIILFKNIILNIFCKLGRQ